MFSTFPRRAALGTPVNPTFHIVFALPIAIGITLGLSISAARADWRHYRHYGWHHYYGWQQRLHPDNIYVSHCRGGWVNCGRDSAKNRQDTNPQQP